MQQKKLTRLFNNFNFIFVLAIISFFVNKYYSSQGVMPLDNFVLYNGGYKVLNGYVPFNDYWLVTGPLLDYLNAFYFKIFGVNWSAYTTHSSTFNSIITILTYIFLISIGLKKEWSFIYSLLFALLMYPVVGTPFVDHHSTIFLLIGYYLFIISIVSKRHYILYFIPLIMVLGFLSKQTPAAYGIFGIIFTVCLLFFIDKKKCFQLFRYLIFGSAGAIIFIFILKSFLYSYSSLSKQSGG